MKPVHVTVSNPTHPPLKACPERSRRIWGGERRGYERIIKEILIRAARLVRYPKSTAISVIFIGDAKMRTLNRRYRGKDRVTNVLAFPVTPHPPLSLRERAAVGRVRELGDVFICLPQARREAKRYGLTLQYEIARLALHGFLHLIGYDHYAKNDRVNMEKIESKILAYYA